MNLIIILKYLNYEKYLQNIVKFIRLDKHIIKYNKNYKMYIFPFNYLLIIFILLKNI